MHNNDFKNVHKLAEGWWKITPNQLESKVTIMCNTIVADATCISKKKSPVL